MRPQVKKQLPRLLALCASRTFGKALVIRSLKNNTRRKEVSMGSLSRKDRYEAQQILQATA